MGQTGSAPAQTTPDGGPKALPLSPRLTMVISSLTMGGAERVMTELANHWAARGWTITIIHYSPPGTPAAFPLDPRIREVQLGLHRVSRNPISAIINNLRRVRVLRHAITQSRPEVVLSFMANVITLMATTGSGLPVLVSEHRGPRGELNRPWSILREITYRHAAFVVMLTPSALAHLSPALQRRGRVVPNPLPTAFLTKAVAMQPTGVGAKSDSPVIMAIGRLGTEKGFDLLIQAFAQIATSWPTARLVIWGEGDERDHLERLTFEMGLAGRIDLPGNTNAPETELLSATIFVLSSRKEGLPMVLIEAMAIGRPVIAFDCDHGPRDIIHDGVDGLLVPPEDTDALVAAIEKLLRDDELRASLSRRAVEVRDRFTIDAVTTKWQALFQEAMRDR